MAISGTGQDLAVAATPEGSCVAAIPAFFFRRAIMTNKIFITCGDVNGIGNELILKTVRDNDNTAFFIVGNRRIFDLTSEILGIKSPLVKNMDSSELIPRQKIEPGIYFIDIPVAGLKLEFGKPLPEAGLLAGTAIKTAVGLSLAHNSPIVTAPINKYSLHLGGFDYPGHTEFIAEILKSKDHLMILDGGVIRVALVTTHLALSDVSGSVTENGVFEKGRILYLSLKNDYGIKEPEITVCSLNPHAGDGGLFGDEDEKKIKPAVRRLNEEICRGCGIFTGPVPSDTAFTESFLNRSDAHLVMYHDQGLIPLKLLSFGKAINFTAGLPIVRTSPDHGTAYDIAGKNIAATESFKKAVEKAVFFSNNRLFKAIREP